MMGYRDQIWSKWNSADTKRQINARKEAKSVPDVPGYFSDAFLRRIVNIKAFQN
jgi:hypothetical protein